MNTIEKQQRRIGRSRRTHVVAKAAGHPRLVVYRSNTTIYAQIVDDAANKIVCGTSGLKTKKTGVEAAKEVGKAIGEMAKKNKVTKVAFDRNGFQYHGQVKALAEAAREAGLDF